MAAPVTFSLWFAGLPGTTAMRPTARASSKDDRTGRFAFTREAVFHDEADVDADRIMGLARSLGLVAELLALGVSEDDLGLTKLEETTRRVLGDRRVPWILGYRVRLGVTRAS